jgi:perosamine synthetase
MNIPLSRPSLSKSESDVIRRVIKSKWLTHGYYNQKFENFFKSFIGTKYSLSLNSCTSALQLALMCQNIKGEVIVPSFTWLASANAIILAGATPVFCDSDLKTRNVKSEYIEPLINKRTEAIMIVHYGGQVCEMDEIIKLVNKYKLKLIEDSAETIGGTWKNKYAGSWGVGCFSFFPTKNITTGEGGMITCSNKKLYDHFKTTAAHGIKSQSYERERKNILPWKKVASTAGFNFRMSNILAGIGFEQIKKINKLNKKRIKNALIYNEIINTKKLPIETPYKHPLAKHVYQTYSILVEPKIRDKLVLFLKKNNIGASVHFTPALHLQKYYKELYPARLSLINAELLSKSIISLPMFPDLLYSEIKYVCKYLEKFFKN